MRAIRLLAHFFTVTLSTFLVIFTSIAVATYIGIPTDPVIAAQLLIMMLVHIFSLFVVFNVSSNNDLDIRVNPYLTFCEWVLHRKLPFVAAMVEFLGQVFGALFAALLFYGVTETTEFLSAVPLTNSGGSFGLEVFAGFFVSWVYFHNYYGPLSRNLPYTMGSIVGITSAIVFPYIGATTHNPLRYLAACIPAQSCSNAWWVYVFGPLVGFLLGFFASRITKYNKKK